MSTQADSCPQTHVLVEFLSGDLSQSAIETLEAHLSQCPSCGDTLRAMNRDDTLLTMARAVEPLGDEDAQLVNRLVSQLQQLEPRETLKPASLDDDVQARAEEVRRLLAPAEEPDELGRLAHYRILKLLGTGGMGVVYQAEDLKLGRLVALKVLRPSLGMAARERFMHEARAAAAIDHDHVITIYQVDREGPLAFIAMQWLEGETLECRLKRQGRLTPSEAEAIGKQIALGLAAAHEKGLIHRDIKPANVWLEAERGRARILDFGLARTVDDNPQLTETGMIAGTPAYMSPEQSRGGEASERSDLFSLGCVLYRAVTGRFPFQASNALAMLRAIQEEEPAMPRKVAQDISPRLSDLIMWLLAKVPHKRPSSANAWVDAIIDPQIEIPHGAETRSTTEDTHASTPAPAGGSRNRWWRVALVLIFLAPIGFLAAPTVFRVVTNQGQLVIRTNDPEVTVEVIDQGNTVRIVDLRTNQSVAINVPAGEYRINLSNSANDVRLTKSKVTLYRGGRELVEVMKVDPTQQADSPTDEMASGKPTQVPVEDAASGATPPAQYGGESENTYQGISLAMWLARAQRERSPAELQNTTKALAALGNSEHAEVCARAVLNMMRVHGTRNESVGAFMGDPRLALNHEARRALFQMSPPGVVKALVTEIDEGNERSHAFTLSLLPRPTEFIYRSDLADYSHLEAELKRARLPIIKQLLKKSSLANAADRRWATALLAKLCTLGDLDYAAVDGLVPRLQQELLNPEANDRLVIAECLVQAAPDSPGLVEALLRDMDESKTQLLAIQLIGELREHGGAAVPRFRKRIREFHKLSSFGALPQEGAKPTTEMIIALGKMGSAAGPALPELHQVAQLNISSPALRRVLVDPAEVAIAAIESALAASQQAIESFPPFDIEFRVVPNSPNDNRLPAADPSEPYNLAAEPPPALAFLWVEIHRSANLPDGPFVKESNGNRYMLLANTAPYVANFEVQSEGRLEKVELQRAADDRVSLRMSLDDVAAEQLKKLSEANLQNHLAILINGKVVSAPRIHSAFSSAILLDGYRSVDELRAVLPLDSPAVQKEVAPHLQELLELKKALRDTVRARFDAGRQSLNALLVAEISLVEAKLRIAESRSEWKQRDALLRELLQLHERHVESVLTMHQQGNVPAAVLAKAQEALIEARLRQPSDGNESDEPN